MEVKLGKPMLESVGEEAMSASWAAPKPLAPGIPASSKCWAGLSGLIDELD